MNYTPLPVTSEQVDKYRGYVEEHAAKYAAAAASRGTPLCEFDDLVQVGMIRVWTVLRRGQTPSAPAVKWAMIDELRKHTPPGPSEPIPDDLDAEFLALDGLS